MIHDHVVVHSSKLNVLHCTGWDRQHCYTRILKYCGFRLKAFSDWISCRGFRQNLLWLLFDESDLVSYAIRWLGVPYEIQPKEPIRKINGNFSVLISASTTDRTWTGTSFIFDGEKLSYQDKKNGIDCFDFQWSKLKLFQ